MAVPTADQYTIEEWTGAYQPAEHSGLYDRFQDGHLVALWVLRKQRAGILCGPAKAATDGDYSEDYTSTLEHLDTVIGELEHLCVQLGLDVSVGRSLLTPSTVSLGGTRFR